MENFYLKTLQTTKNNLTRKNFLEEKVKKKKKLEEKFIKIRATLKNPGEL